MTGSETFDWRKTTPDSTVGTEISNAFWGSSPDFELFSSRGIVSHKEARVAPVELTFVDEVPIVPESMLGFGFIRSLREHDHLQNISIGDIVEQLEKSPRTANQLVSVWQAVIEETSYRVPSDHHWCSSIFHTCYVIALSLVSSF